MPISRPPDGVTLAILPDGETSKDRPGFSLPAVTAAHRVHYKNQHEAWFLDRNFSPVYVFFYPDPRSRWKPAATLMSQETVEVIRVQVAVVGGNDFRGRLFRITQHSPHPSQGDAGAVGADSHAD